MRHHESAAAGPARTSDVGRRGALARHRSARASGRRQRAEDPAASHPSRAARVPLDRRRRPGVVRDQQPEDFATLGALKQYGREYDEEMAGYLAALPPSRFEE